MQKSESAIPTPTESPRLLEFPRELRKSRGRIARHPKPIRDEICRKLRDAWSYPMICDWLFALKAETDIPALRLKAGDPYSLVWTRGTRDLPTAQLNFRCRLSKFFHNHYATWQREQADREEIAGLVDRVEELSTAAGEKARENSATGGTLLIRSLLMDAIDVIRKRDSDPAGLARLANAWARMNHSGLELEKFKVQTQKAIDLGLQVLREEIKKNPEALAAFRKLRDIVQPNQNPTN